MSYAKLSRMNTNYILIPLRAALFAPWRRVVLNDTQTRGCGGGQGRFQVDEYFLSRADRRISD